MKNYKQKTSDAEKKDLKLVTPKVTEYMAPKNKLITFAADTQISEVVETLLSKRITGAPVLNNRGEVVGLIDDKDCLNMLVTSAYYNQPATGDTVSHFMSNVMKSISEDTDIVAAANIFLTTPYKRLLVMDKNGKLAGQISRRDILRAIKDINTNTW